jgi:hypothetical protein
MRSPEDCAFIRDRVLQDIKERPSIRPYLGETPRAQRTVCKRGHAQTGPGACLACRAAYKRQRRAEGISW